MIPVSPKELYEFLKASEIHHLFFSCTVKNACSMLNSNTLMSFLQLSLKQLPMTDVDNPSLYKQTCMWNKIPLYLKDLHGYFPRQNKLGPVCLKISTDFLLEINERDLYISKRNPLNWKKKFKSDDICYSSVCEFSENFNTLYSDRRIHKNIILIRDKKSQINLTKYLTEIYLDKPEKRYLLFKNAQDTLTATLMTSGLKSVPLKITNCENFCFCQTNYSEMPKSEIENLFLP